MKEKKVTSADDFFFEHKEALAFMVNGIPTRDFSFPSPDDREEDAYSFYTYADNFVKNEIFIPYDAEISRVEEKTAYVKCEDQVIEITALY